MKATKYVNKVVKAIVPLGVVAGILALVSPAASATMVMAILDGNDCTGFFETDNGFDSCELNGSSVIAKFEGNPLKVDEANDIGEIDNFDFPSISLDGSEWTFSDNVENVDEELISGTWAYMAGDNDPEIRYWATKAGNGFKLFWEVPADKVGEGKPCVDPEDAFTDACLDEALSQTTGEWFTLGEKELSHITFYDTEGGGDGGQVPEPGVLVLLATGLLGIGLVRRRGRQA